MSDKDSSSSRKWDKLDTLVFFAGGSPHEKARNYVLDKAWEKAYYGNTSTSTYGSSTSTGGGSSVEASKSSDTDKDKPPSTSEAK
jgi:hypothetical protein